MAAPKRRSAASASPTSPSIRPPAAPCPTPSGVAGTPGPLDGYCTSLGANPETGSPVSQPAGTTLPFAPYYFPDVVRNADGSLTGYFDYRPKDADEAITVARSTDGGKTWTSEGEALEQNGGYCPTADTNDDGQGHPFVAAIGGSHEALHAAAPGRRLRRRGHARPRRRTRCERPAGRPALERIGRHRSRTPSRAPKSKFRRAAASSIPVSTLGSEGSPEHIVAGAYEDLNAASPSKSIITCRETSTSPLALTGCTVAGSSAITVDASDDIVQVIATVSTAAVIPAGPNKPSGEGGLAELKFTNGNSSVSPFTTFILNENAPNRLYIDGDTVYCTQSNANPTTKVEDCTNTSGSR